MQQPPVCQSALSLIFCTCSGCSLALFKIVDLPKLEPTGMCQITEIEQSRGRRRARQEYIATKLTNHLRLIQKKSRWRELFDPAFLAHLHLAAKMTVIMPVIHKRPAEAIRFHA